MNPSNDLVTLVIQHYVKPQLREDYESWLKSIAQIAQEYPGHMGVNVIRPHGSSTEYTIVLRFDSHAHLIAWVESDRRRELIEQVQSLLLEAEQLEIQTGMEFWFTPPNAKQLHAKPFKQFLITLSAIFPLTVLIPWALHPLFRSVPVLGSLIASRFIVAVVIVYLMVYVIMPRYSRLVASWLFR